MLLTSFLLFIACGVGLTSGQQDWNHLQWQLSQLDHCVHCAQPLLSMVMGLVDFDLKSIANTDFLSTKCRELEEQRHCLNELSCWEQMFNEKNIMATLDYICQKRKDLVDEASCWRESSFQTGALTCVGTIVHRVAPPQQTCTQMSRLKACIIPQAAACSSRAARFIRDLLDITLHVDGC